MIRNYKRVVSLNTEKNMELLGAFDMKKGLRRETFYAQHRDEMTETPPFGLFYIAVNCASVRQFPK